MMQTTSVRSTTRARGRNYKRATSLLSRRRKLMLEMLEDRRLLAAVTHPWVADVTFNQFTGGNTGTIALGYDQFGNEDAEFIGLDLGADATIANAGFLAVDGNLSTRLGLEYGFYATDGVANAQAAGDFIYEVIDSGSGPVKLQTRVETDSASIITQSPTVRSFADLVLELEAGLDWRSFGFDVGNTSIINIDEALPLFSINRNGGGEVAFLGISPSAEFFDELKQARSDRSDALQELQRAQIKIADPKLSAEEFEAAKSALQAADTKLQNAKQAETDANRRARNKVNKPFSAGPLQISVGAAEDLLGVEFEVAAVRGPLATKVGGLSLTVPDIGLVDTSLENGLLLAESSLADRKSDIASVSLDIAGIIGSFPALPPGILGKNTVAGGAFSYRTLSYDIVASLGVNQKITTKPRQTLVLNFVDEVTGAAAIVDASINGQLQSGVSRISFSPGDDVQLETRGTQRVRVTPTLQPSFTFTNDIGLDISLGGRLRALELEVPLFGGFGPLLDYPHSYVDIPLGSILTNSFTPQGAAVSFDSFIIGGPIADLSVSVENAEEITDGTEKSLLVRVQNSGPATATNVVASLRLPQEFIASAVFPPNCVLSGTTLTCSVSQIRSGEEFSFEITVHPNLGTYRTVRYGVEVSSDARERTPYNNVDFGQTYILSPEVFLVNLSTWDRFEGGCDLFCSLREAVYSANNKPGPDVIWVPFGFEFSDFKGEEIVVTDSVEIVGPESGAVIQFEGDKLRRGYLDHNQEVRLWVPQDNNGLTYTARELVDFINMPLAHENERWGFTARLEEEGDGIIDFAADGGVFADASLGPFVSGGPGQPASLTIDPPGEDNRFTIFAPAGMDTTGLFVNVRDVEVKRSRFLRFAGDGQNQYVIRNLNFHGGNGVSYARRNSLDFLGSDVRADENTIVLEREFRDDDIVTYNAIDGQVIPGLVDGNQYRLVGPIDTTFRIPFEFYTLDGQRVSLGNVPAGSRHVLNGHKLTKTSGSKQLIFSSAQVNDVGDTIEMPGHGLQNGDPLYYQALSGSETLGLSAYDFSGQVTYYVVNATTDAFQVSLEADGQPEKLDPYNAVRGVDGVGGAILLDDPDDQLILENVQITRSHGEYGGAVGVVGGGSLELINTTLDDNSAMQGGGLYQDSGNLSIQSSQVSNNWGTSSVGGVRFISRGSLSIFDSQFVDNRADSAGANLSVLLARSVTMGRNVIAGGPPQNAFMPSVGVKSQGQNLLDNNDFQLVRGLDAAGDRVAQRISLSGATVSEQNILSALTPVGVAGAIIGVARLNVPSAGEGIVYSVSDDRFEFRGTTLALKPGIELSANTPAFSLELSAFDPGLEATWTQQVELEPVAAPENAGTVEVSNRTPEFIEVTWTATSNAAETEFILAITEVGSSQIRQARLDKHSRTASFRELRPDANYEIELIAQNVSGTTRYPKLQVATPPLPPSSIRNAELVAVDATSVLVTWQDAVGEASYRVLQSHEGVVTREFELQANSSSFELTDLEPLSTVELTVVAENNGGQSASDTLFVTLRPEAPIAPVIEHYEVGDTTLKWQASSGADSYQIWQFDADGLKLLVELPQGQTSIVLEPFLDSNVHKRFWVTAANEGGNTMSWAVSGVGASLDTLHLTSQSASLLLADLVDRIPSLQSIDTVGVGANGIQLDAGAIRLLPGTQLQLQADLDDTLQYDDGWSFVGSQSTDGETFRVLVNGNAVLKLNRPDHYRNPLYTFDVNADGSLSPIDALFVINELNKGHGSQLLDPSNSTEPIELFIDTNGDSFLSPIDALLVVNFLNARHSGEGEPTPASLYFGGLYSFPTVSSSEVLQTLTQASATFVGTNQASEPRPATSSSKYGNLASNLLAAATPMRKKSASYCFDQPRSISAQDRALLALLREPIDATDADLVEDAAGYLFNELQVLLP